MKSKKVCVLSLIGMVISTHFILSTRMMLAYQAFTREMISHKETQTTMHPVDMSDSFGACLLIKDDNHWLVEWIAYHWFALPLRHLVVYVDPQSETSPQPILDRWKNYMTIQVWNETYVPDQSASGGADATPHAFHRTVQNTFLQDCMRRYKREQWTSYIVLADTDEFVSVNDWHRHQENSNPAAIHRTNVPSTEEPGSVMKFLQQQQSKGINNVEENNPKCIPMYRLQVCMGEEDKYKNISLLVGDEDWTQSDFLTHNFKWGERDRDVKNMVHIGGIPNSYFDTLQLPKKANHPIVHNPVPGYCLDVNLQPGSLRVPRDESLFQVYHYTGTLEQRLFRSDIRGAFGARGGTLPPEKCLNVPADDLRPWLKGFVTMVGQQEAARLLEGVGRVHSWPAYVK